MGYDNKLLLNYGHLHGNLFDCQALHRQNIYLEAEQCDCENNLVLCLSTEDDILYNLYDICKGLRMSKIIYIIHYSMKYTRQF